MEMYYIRYLFFVFYRTILSGSFCDYSTLMHQHLIILPKNMALIISCHLLIRTISYVPYRGILLYRILYFLTTAFLMLYLFVCFNFYIFFFFNFFRTFFFWCYPYCQFCFDMHFNLWSSLRDKC